MRQEIVRQRRWLVPVTATLLMACLPAQANIVLSVVPATAVAGSVGDFLDIDITNSGPSAQNISAFTLALSVGASSGITFTGGNESSAATYLFTSLDSFDIALGQPYTAVPPPSGQSVQASDLSLGGTGTTIASGSTFGLGHIEFDVAPGTPAGPVTVSLAATCLSFDVCTSLSDFAGSAVPFTVSDGAITVTPGTSAVPEPGTLWLGLLGVVAIARLRR